MGTGGSGSWSNQGPLANFKERSLGEEGTGRPQRLQGRVGTRNSGRPLGTGRGRVPVGAQEWCQVPPPGSKAVPGRVTRVTSE